MQRKKQQAPAKKEKTIEKVPDPPVETKVKFDPSPFIKKGISDEEIISMKECFDLFDTDQSGTIDINEMKEMIKSMNLESNPEKILALAENTDTDKDQKIDFQEFLNLLSFYDFDHEDDEQLMKIFNKFSDSKEIFNIEDLKKMADYAGETYSDEQFENMIKFADHDKDNGINFEEFKHVVIKGEPKNINKA